MLSRRLVVCLDVIGDRVVKGMSFESLRDVGDPAQLATWYESEGADEIVFLDIGASAEKRGTLLREVRRTAERLFIPLTVGGGVRSVDDVARTLRAGADKVSMNSAAVASPRLIGDAAARFGSQCVVASIDAKREETGWRVFTHGGRLRTPLDAVSWAVQCVEEGAGEILLTSIDRDGMQSGYDLELTRAVSEAVPVPVIASGGAGSPSDIVDVIRSANADAALVAGIVHNAQFSVAQLKQCMVEAGIKVRAAA